MKKYIIIGAGHDGLATMNYLGKEKIVCFFDSNKTGDVDGIPIRPLTKINEYCDTTTVILAVSKAEYIVEISKVLHSYNIEYVFWKDLVTVIIRSEGSAYNSMNIRDNFAYDPCEEYIIVDDRYNNAGGIGNYFWQDLWASSLINMSDPSHHYDIGSRVDGFIAHLLSQGRKVTQIDIRPLPFSIEGLDFVQADATTLDGIEDNSIDSLSALCSLEHFGLGRYGDPIDPEACFKCFEAIGRKIKPSGDVYISVPIGKEKLFFNAHRVFYPQTIIDSFAEFKLVELSCCFPDRIERNIDIHKYDELDGRGAGLVGLFHLNKRN